MYRRQMMITIELLEIVVAGPLGFAADSKRPNIIFFLTDDQRNDTLGCEGHPIIQTPTIDRLAAEGVRFKNSFCEVPICASNRSTLFTGLSQRTHGYNFGTPPVPEKYVATSYPALLREAGYRTGFAGKYGMQFENVKPIENGGQAAYRGLRRAKR